MKSIEKLIIEEFTVEAKKSDFNNAVLNIPVGYRLPSKKELMLMYVMDDGVNLDLPKSNVWSSDEYTGKNNVSTSAFAVQLSNGYTATMKKTEKLTVMYVKK
jgi:hypothetical protein